MWLKSLAVGGDTAHQSNPILRRAVGPRWQRSLAVTFTVLGGLWLLAAAVALLKIPPLPEGTLPGSTRSVVMVIAMLSPFLTTAAAVQVMSRRVSDEVFQLLRQSPLPDMNMLAGYALGILHQLRILLVPLLGALPVMAVLLPGAHARAHLSLPVFLVGLNLFGVLLGVALVLRWGREGVLLIFAVLGSGLSVAVLTMLFDASRLPDVRVLPCDFKLDCLLARQGLGGWTTAVMIAPFVLGIAATATPWRRMGPRPVEMALLVLASGLLWAGAAYSVWRTPQVRDALVARLSAPDPAESRRAAALLLRAGWLRDALTYAAPPQINLPEAFLSDLYLNNAFLDGANLQGANLRRASLEYASLRSANLRGANLSEARLFASLMESTDLSGANLEMANMQRIYLAAANLRHSNLRGADLRHAAGYNIDFSSADVEGATLDFALLDFPNFSGSNLSGASLTYANLQGANFQGADLRGTNLRESNLVAVLMEGALFSAETVLPDGTTWSPDSDLGRFTDNSSRTFWRSKDPGSPAFQW